MIANLIIGILSLIKYTWNNIPNTVFDNRDNIPNTVTVLGIFFSWNNIPNTETVLGIFFFIPNTDLCVRRHPEQHPPNARLPTKQSILVYIPGQPTRYRLPPLPQHATQSQLHPYRNHSIAPQTPHRPTFQPQFFRRVPYSTNNLLHHRRA